MGRRVGGTARWVGREVGIRGGAWGRNAGRRMGNAGRRVGGVLCRENCCGIFYRIWRAASMRGRGRGGMWVMLGGAAAVVVVCDVGSEGTCVV